MTRFETYNAFKNLGYALTRFPAAGGPVQCRDPKDGAWKPFDPSFVVPFPPQFPAPNQAVRTAAVPPDAIPCSATVYELDDAGQPVAAIGGVAVEAERTRTAGGTIVINNY